MKTIIRLTSMIVLMLCFGISEVWGTAASLPFSFDNGYSSISTTDGISQYGLSSSDYASSPKLKMDGTGDYVLVEINAAPDKLGYKIKGNPSSGTSIDVSFYVLESPDGTHFTPVTSYSTLSNSVKTESNIQLKRSTRFIKFMYDYKYTSGGGNVALGAISVSALSSSKMKVSFSGGTTAFAALTEASVGAGVTLPTATTNAAGWKFWGWSTSNVSSKTTTVPTTFVGKGGDTYYPESDVTLYAVFAKGEFTKITTLEELAVDKKYLIVTNSGGKNYVMNSCSYYIGDGFRTLGTELSEASLGKFHSGDIATWQFTIEGSANDYVIRDVFNDEDENYVDIAYDVWFNQALDDADTYTLSVMTGVWTIKNNYESDGDYAFLTFETTNNAFYTEWDDSSPGATILLYKETTTTNYWGSPTVVTLSEGSLSHADILFDPEIVATDSETPADRQVTIIVEPASGYAICYPTKPTFTKSSGTATATYVSGPTDNGDGTYSYVYQFAQNDNGAGTFGISAGQLSFYRTGCYREFTDAEDDGLWNTKENWTNNRLPNINDQARIYKPVIVDTDEARAKSVVLMQNSSNTGQLIIDAGQELVVAGTVRKTTDGSNYTATGENDIVINSTSGAGLGALVMGTHDGTNKATVNFCTKSKGKKEDTSSDAQYVGTPFGNEPAMLYQFYNSWMYKFTNTGTPGWVRVQGDDGLKAFQGYCVFSADAWGNDGGHSYWMQGTLVSSEDQSINLVHYGDAGIDANDENMLANSWMAPIKIAAFNEYDAFTNADATIYIYNTGSPDDYAAHEEAGTTAVDGGSMAGQYATYTPGTAGSAIIPSMQAFSVYTSSSGAKVTLDYSKLVYDPAGSVGPGPNKAPKRAGVSEDEADKMRLFVRTEDGYGDMLYMWEREDFAEGFENGWDGRKMFGEDVAPQLYAVTPDGNMAINCIPTFEGQLLGFRKGTQDNFYTFTFEYEGENTWYLNDLKEQTSTLISAESTYMFMASDEDMAARFIISQTPIHYMPTGTEQSAISDQQSAVKKIVIDDKVFIIRNGQMYDVTGVMVR